MSKKRANGEGTCYQLADGSWRAVSADKSVYRTRKTQRAAMAARDQELARRGGAVIGAASTVAAYLRSFAIAKLSAVPPIRPTTYAGYVAIAETHIIPIIGNISLEHVNPSDVQRVIDAAVASSKSASTIIQIYGFMLQAFQRASNKQLMLRNPCADTSVSVPKKRTAEVQPLYAGEVQSFLKVASDDEYEALWLMAIGFGPRRGEAIGIDLRDAEVWLETPADGAAPFYRAIVRVGKSLQRYKLDPLDPKCRTTLQCLPPKTRKSSRTIELPTIAAESLHRWLLVRANRKATSAHWEDSGYLFCTKYGTALEPRKVTERFQQLLELANGTKRKLHILRHTAASMALA